MKKSIAFAILLVISINSFCQPLTSDDYLKKSKHQKAAAWTMFAGGAAVIAIALAVAASDLQSSGNGAKVFLAVGGASMIGSVPFFLAAGKNKRNAAAASASFQMKKRPVIQAASVVNRLYPALTIRIEL
jgi:hypothetical protein